MPHTNGRRTESRQDAGPNQYSLIPFWTSRIITVSLGASPLQILPSDKRRVSFLISTDNVEGCRILPANNVSSTRGLTITAANGTREFTFKDHGTVIGDAWFGISTGASTDLTVIETLFDPGGFSRSRRRVRSS